MKKIIILLAFTFIIGGCKSFPESNERHWQDKDYIPHLYFLRDSGIDHIPEPSPKYGSLTVLFFQEIALYGDKQWGKIFDDPTIPKIYKERILEDIKMLRIKNKIKDK